MTLAGIGSFLLRGAANAALHALASAVEAGARWALHGLGGLITATSSPNPLAGWFAGSHGPFQAMRGVALVLAVPLLLIGVIQAFLRQDPGEMARRGLLYPALAALGLIAGLGLAGLLLGVTDWASAAMARGMGGHVSTFLDHMTNELGGAGTAGVPVLVVLVVALVMLVGAFFLWLELLVRSAAVFVALLFLPVALAALLWPAAAGLLKRLVEFLVAITVSKFVIVSVLALGAAAVGSRLGGGGGAGPGIETLLTGMGLVGLAVFSPFVVLRWVPLAEAALAAHGVARRPLQAGSRAATGMSRAMELAGQPELPAGRAGLAAASQGVGLPLAMGVAVAHGAKRAIGTGERSVSEAAGEKREGQPAGDSPDPGSPAVNRTEPPAGPAPPSASDVKASRPTPAEASPAGRASAAPSDPTPPPGHTPTRPAKEASDGDP